MEYVFLIAFATGLFVLAKSFRHQAPKKLPMQAWCDYKKKAYLELQPFRTKQPPTTQANPERLRMRRFSKSMPTQLEAIAELLWFAEAKHERGEYIGFDDLPTIRTGQGVERVVLVRTIHFMTLLGEYEQLQRRNAIVLEVPEPNA